MLKNEKPALRAGFAIRSPATSPVCRQAGQPNYVAGSLRPTNKNLIALESVMYNEIHIVACCVSYKFVSTGIFLVN